MDVGLATRYTLRRYSTSLMKIEFFNWILQVYSCFQEYNVTFIDLQPGTLYKVTITAIYEKKKLTSLSRDISTGNSMFFLN